jgi:hypothetical protein
MSSISRRTRVSDESHPERSAILLASGDGREDGLLQAREIEALDLDGRMVVLSACQTAAGAVQSGEGVLSLARAFFEAGAHAVVGSRWPLRDADAAMLFDAFYRHLGEGASLAGGPQAHAGRSPRRGTPILRPGPGSCCWAMATCVRSSTRHRPPRSKPLLVLATVVALLVLLAIALRRRHAAVSAR